MILSWIPTIDSTTKIDHKLTILLESSSDPIFVEAMKQAATVIRKTTQCVHYTVTALET